MHRDLSTRTKMSLVQRPIVLNCSITLNGIN